MRNPNKNEDLTGKYFIPVSNHNSHNYEISKIYKVTNKGFPQTPSTYEGLIHNGNIIESRDMLIIDEANSEILDRNLKFISMYPLYYLNDKPIGYKNGENFVFVNYNNKNYKNFLNVIFNITDNCQIASVRNFKSCFELNMSEYEINILLHNIYYNIGKSLLLIDINNSFEKQVDNLFNYSDELVLKTHYTSSNNSKMIMYLVNIKIHTSKNKINEKINRCTKYFDSINSILKTINDYNK